MEYAWRYFYRFQGSLVLCGLKIWPCVFEIQQSILRIISQNNLIIYRILGGKIIGTKLNQTEIETQLAKQHRNNIQQQALNSQCQ
ncbi:hypothetical protein FGO68_gene12569 [Halteria grandinella]|uniref:Uncharacterized protein n=1 Tax=Halteria grandinella TaxID=5974 RepID=A0A8J8TB09_HALGN|nr:hypothetical protein FGO68_gene12569 [Halteria grandinella]